MTQPAQAQTFADLGVPTSLVALLAARGITDPTPIQAATLPDSLAGRDVLVVEDIIDSGLTLSWLKANLESRGPASVEICTLFRKPEAVTCPLDVKYVGFDIPNEFVIGYGLDYAERYRDLPYVGTLHPRVYSDAD